MSINRNNYEAFFLDYRENNLNLQQVAELMVFLKQNPDLKEEFESFETIHIVPDKNIRFDVKETLKKGFLIPTDNIDASNYDHFMVANLEGDLSEDESLELKAFINLNPKTKLEYNIYRSTFLKPDQSIQLSNKNELKKTGLFVIYRTQLIYSLSVAASIIILLGVYFSIFEKPSQPVFTDSIKKINAKTISSGESLFNDQSNIKSLQKIEFRQSEQAVHGVVQAGKQAEHNVEGLARMDLRKISSISHVNTAVINSVNSVFSDSQLSAISAIELASNEDVKTHKSFVSRFIGGLAGKVIKTENLRGKSFLDFTVEGYNLMADKEVELEKEVDENGKVIVYSLNGENLSFFKNRNQQKE
jgi:hypothetical protein